MPRRGGTRPTFSRPRGRPRLSDTEDTVALYVRAPASTYARYTAAAEAAGVSLSEWARGVLDRAAKRTR